MSELLKTCLLVCPFIFMAGFVDSVAGGGGLISLPAYLFAGIPVHLSSGTNKVVNSVGTACAAVQYLRSGQVRVRVAVWSAVSALLGASLGTRLALWLSDQMLQICVLVALPIAAAIMVLKKDLGAAPAQESRWTPRQELGLSLLIGFGTGMYDGLVGPGTGTFMIMAFSMVLGLDLLLSSGCAKVANLASNVSSAIVWMVGGKVYWEIVLPCMACCVLGNLCGARYAIRGGSGKVRGMIFVVLGLLFVKMLWELLV